MVNFTEELFERKKDKAIEIMNFAYREKHDYIFLNVENQKMYRNFDEIIMHDDDEN